VRAGPGVSYDLVGVVHKGDALDAISRTPAGDWLRVKTAQGREGWIAANFVALFVPIDQIPEETDIPPTPTPTPAPDQSSTGQWLPLSQDPV
jgi:hypothetical protein